MNVGDVMTRKPITVSPDTKLSEVIERLYELDVRHLPIVENGELMGIVSDRDIKQYSLPPIDQMLDPDRAASRLDQPIGGIMHGSPLTVQPDTAVKEVVELFLEEKIGAVPVVEGHTSKLVGIISYVDILKALYSEEGPLG
jgi:acetoin utilization protein AcuB